MLNGFVVEKNNTFPTMRTQGYEIMARIHKNSTGKQD
jgi:hypothetical protein